MFFSVLEGFISIFFFNGGVCSTIFLYIFCYSQHTQTITTHTDPGAVDFLFIVEICTLHFAANESTAFKQLQSPDDPISCKPTG